jgi:hypothetical protein
MQRMKAAKERADSLVFLLRNEAGLLHAGSLGLWQDGPSPPPSVRSRSSSPSAAAPAVDADGFQAVGARTRQERPPLRASELPTLPPLPQQRFSYSALHVPIGSSRSLGAGPAVSPMVDPSPTEPLAWNVAAAAASSAGAVIDLHGQSREAAVRMVEAVVLPQARAAGLASVDLITGRGVHSGPLAPVKVSVGALLRRLKASGEVRSFSILESNGGHRVFL